MKFRYPGRAYRQAQLEDAPWLVSFVADVSELSQWAGVPRRTEQNQAGFQRLEDQGRIDRAKEFFQQPANQSPTSLILGLHGELADGIRASMVLTDADETGASRACELVIELLDDLTPEQARMIVSAQLRQRLATPSNATEIDDEASDQEPPSDDLEDEADNASDLLDEQEVDGESDDTPSGTGEEIELGRSILSDLANRLDDPDWLAEGDNSNAVLDMAKPATIIDGQHRLLGADATERGIPFSVVALVDCPWAEQVFQFTVVNYTAKGIPDQFITANAALSLTKSELDLLKDRLMQANVKIKEYELMRVVNFDHRSPFADLINLSEQRNTSLIGYKTMVSVANGWHDANHQFFNTLLPRLYPDVTGKGKKTKWKEKWREEAWGEFFLSFWQEVYAKYRTEPSHLPGHTLWEVGYSQLTVAVVLAEVQKAFLDNLNAQDEDFFDVPEKDDPLDFLTEKVRQRAKKFVAFLPPTLFATKWGITSLNTGSGRKDLESCIRSMVDAKGKFQFTQHRLITGV